MVKNKIKFSDISKNRNLLSVFISILIFFIVLLISSTNFLYIFDKKVQDLYFKFTDVKVNKDIIIIEIDEDTLSGRKNQNGEVLINGLGRFPFNRSYYAEVLDNITIDGAGVIAIDIIFGEKSDKNADKILSESIKKSGNVILGLWPDSSGVLQKPYKPFGDYALYAGYFAPNIDTITNIAYSIRPYSKFKRGDEFVDHFTLATIKGYYSRMYSKEDYLTSKNKLTNNSIIIANDIELLRSREGKNEVLINYAPSYKFNKISFLDAYNNNFEDGFFKDKIVFIGATAKGIKDTFFTPLGLEFGVYVHANMVNTILTKSGIKYFDKNLEWFLIFLIIVVSVYFNISKSSYVLVFSNIALIALFILLILYITILTNLLLNFPIELVVALIFSLTISNIVKYLIENKHKTKLNKALSEYVSADVAHEILSGEGKVNLNGENKRISIFFSDIEGFTSVSEQFSPEKLVHFLREYLGEMSDIIMDEKGFINKYEGDAIMALWGVFGDDTTDTYNVCISALKQQSKLKELNIKWGERGFSEIKARIGLHIGNAIIGNIGSKGRKMEFTALGDSVNLASRLEGVNKFYGTYICVSEDIYNEQKSNFEFRYLDIIRVKGKEKSIKIYELISLKGELDNKLKEIIVEFEKATKLYSNKMFKEAIKIFDKLENKGDTPSKTYKKRCKDYIENHPEDSWDGIWTMDSK